MLCVYEKYSPDSLATPKGFTSAVPVSCLLSSGRPGYLVGGAEEKRRASGYGAQLGRYSVPLTVVRYSTIGATSFWAIGAL